MHRNIKTITLVLYIVMNYSLKIIIHLHLTLPAAGTRCPLQRIEP